MTTQAPISLNGGQKDDLRIQFSALCWRRKRGKLQILLITSRGSKRWIIPKGWPMDGKTPAASALVEAWEEGGVVGQVRGQCLGVYSYAKTGEDGAVPCLAMLYPVKVKTLAKQFPEKGQRKRLWCSRRKAARLVDAPDLARLIRDFDPRNGGLAG
ncbi:MAG: NUDIX hydrolase [Sulfitobacter sp.]|uniref:NUDIX hydrolase n=1 Tax=unclassified Sulfitobacter TaxID=196795 RepID=UPI002943A5B8|nr:NUDIX hydrolase [Sulfitobacter sp. LC.270.F.C4]WOI16621.1 NUDIX hydrolase [Sulfitobacter sp. LC.270.F.C4]